MATIRDEVSLLRTELSAKLDAFILASNAKDMAFSRDLGGVESDVKGLDSRLRNVESSAFWTPKTLGCIAGIAAVVAGVIIRLPH